MTGDPIDALGLAEGGQLTLLAKDGVVISPAINKETFSAGGFENVRGSAEADRLVGDDAANHLRGGNGNDLMSGEGSQDKLTGGRGADIFFLDDADGNFVVVTNLWGQGGGGLSLDDLGIA